MKSTGIVRKVDELGRVVIPIEIRNNYLFPRVSLFTLQTLLHIIHNLFHSQMIVL